MIIDLHTHSIASGHGTTDTVNTLAQAASQKGLTLLGISDHAPAMAGAASVSYFRSLHHTCRKRFGIELLFGAELNILSPDGRVDLDDTLLSGLDYAIISLHAPLFAKHEARIHTQAYIRAMDHPSVCIIGHPDDTHFPILPQDLILAARDRHILPEINNSSLSPDGYRGEAHLIDRQILMLCKAYDVPVIIGSDSHGSAHIGEDQYARKLMAETAFPARLVANDNPALLKTYLHRSCM